MVEGAGELAQLVGERGVRRRGGKFPRSMRSLAATSCSAATPPATDAPQGKQRQQQDPERASQREEGHRLDFIFGVVLEGEHKGINAADKILNVSVIPCAVAAGDVLVHVQPATCSC